MSIWDTIKEPNPVIDFYKKFVEIGFNGYLLWDKLKADYFLRQLPNNTLYKFISFGNDDLVNTNKLSTLENKCLWFAPHHVFTDNDQTEFQIYADTNAIAQKTGYRKEDIDNLLIAVRDVNDICCLSDRNSEYMWDNYANFHSGICCVFEVIKTNDLWPVLYCNKKHVDFTSEIISGLNNADDSSLCMQTLAFISPVLKDECHYKMENEVRLLNGDAYWSMENPLGGILEPNKKESLGYVGRRVSWESYGLKLKKIIIGKETPAWIENSIRAMQLGCIIVNE